MAATQVYKQTFMLSKKDARRLEYLTKKLERTKSDVLRLLIRERAQQEGHKAVGGAS